MTSEVLQPPKLTLARLLLLGASSVVLCMSYFMAVFTPFPLAMATVIYGRAKGYLIALLGMVACLLFGHFFMGGDFTGTGSYVVLASLGLMISEILKRNWAPVKSLVIVGFLFIGVIAAGVVGALKAQDTSLEIYVTKEIAKVQSQFEAAKSEGKMSQDLIDLGLGRPAQELAQDAIQDIPTYFMMAVFFVLWVNCYLTLKGRRLLEPALEHAYDEKALIDFKMPFYGIYFVIAGFGLGIFNDSFQHASIASLMILRIVGIFYFFQGFGIALSLLNHYKIVGFFRTIMVMIVVLFIPWMLAVLGLFDTWFDFNSKFKKQVSN